MTLVFQVALCVSWMFKLSSSPVFVDCSKMCIDRESNPGLSRGRRQFYHWTIDAWQIATITGSFHTCNLFHVGFPSCYVFVESSIYRALLFLLIVQKMCIDRQSNPCLSRGRRQIYHRTIDAWQIATVTGSVHTCTCSHLGFSGCSLCKLNVQTIEFSHFCWLFKNVLPSGIEPVSIAWQATILPLNHWCLTNCNNFWFFQTCHLFQVSCLGCSVFLKSSIYRALPILLIVQKMCIDQQSNPRLSRGRRQIYHWTIDAWQIATITGSFYTCNRIDIGFSVCSLCKLNVQIIEFSCFCWLFKNVHRPGIEPGSIAWQATILPLHHRCLTNWNNYWFLPYMQSISSWFSRLLCVCWKFNLSSSPVFVDCLKNVHRPAIEPLSIAWQATNLPLNHRCLTNCNNYWFLLYTQSYWHWFFRLLSV